MPYGYSHQHQTDALSLCRTGALGMSSTNDSIINNTSLLHGTS